MTMQDYVSAHERKQQLDTKSMPLGQRLSIVKTIKKIIKYIWRAFLIVIICSTTIWMLDKGYLGTKAAYYYSKIFYKMFKQQNQFTEEVTIDLEKDFEFTKNGPFLNTCLHEFEYMSGYEWKRKDHPKKQSGLKTETSVNPFKDYKLNIILNELSLTVPNIKNIHVYFKDYLKKYGPNENPKAHGLYSIDILLYLPEPFLKDGHVLIDYDFAFAQHQQLFDMFVTAGFLSEMDIKEEKDGWVDHRLDISKAKNSILIHKYWVKEGFIFRLKLEKDGIKLINSIEITPYFMRGW